MLEHVEVERSAPHLARVRIEVTARAHGWLWAGGNAVSLSRGTTLIRIVFDTSGRVIRAFVGRERLREERLGRARVGVTDQLIHLLSR